MQYLSFYEDDNCEGPELSTGSPICSNNDSCSAAFEPSYRWSSGTYNYHGNAFIGKTFPTKPDIRCVSVTTLGYQSHSYGPYFSAHHVIVEERYDGDSDWVPINDMELTETDIDFSTKIRLYDPPPAYSIRVRNMDG